MNKIKYFIVAFLFILTSCTPNYTSNKKVISIMPDLTASQQETWTLVIGNWYGHQPTEKGGEIEWICEHQSNGVYKYRFRLKDKNGKVKEQTEIGEWGVAGGIYFSIFKAYKKGDRLIPTDPTSPYTRNAYKIITSSNDSFSYQELNTGNIYTMKRVSEDFDFTPL